MKTYLDCIPCFLRQALDAARMVSPDPGLHEQVLREVLLRVQDLDFDRPPPHMGREIHRVVREISGDPDPYREIKREFNQFALQLYPELKKLVAGSSNPFATAVRLAIAGNIIDFGAGRNVSTDQVRRVIDDSLKAPLPDSDFQDLKSTALQAGKILYLGDNAGEIVLDRFLLEQLPQEKVVFAVKGGPIINDATREDAEVSGVWEMVRVIENGSDAPGTILPECSEEFLKEFEEADLIIAKGQGNYETLNETSWPIVFLLKIKCPVVAEDLGREVGDIVIEKR